uniref:MrfA-like Zn-binding domain-containing protein n=1 Tax=Octactis speculum TaxID=3111310 RepID=A0A7S2AHT8_9STRA|mmetsp:Transcript_10039/g.13119  ORF Transcript_10039/g.13119 Transcript_10039/m.13119 type:complete len:438 (+) Transcript_10039:175-1488(+)
MDRNHSSSSSTVRLRELKEQQQQRLRTNDNSPSSSSSAMTCLETHPFVEAPSRDVSLRIIDPISIDVVDRTGVSIDSIGYSRAFFELFEGAIYLHQGRQFLVTKLDLQQNQASVRPVRVNYFTSSRNHTDVNVIKVLESSLSGWSGCSEMNTGSVSVVTRVWGWRKHWQATGKILDMGHFSLPPLEYETRAVWIDVPEALQRKVMELCVSSSPTCPKSRDDISPQKCDQDVPPKIPPSQAVRSAVHALNHVLVAIAPLFILCDKDDIDTEHVYVYQQRPRPARLIVYDKRPGGVGIAEALYCCGSHAVLSKAYDLVTSCSCAYGCPGCIHDPRCSGQNESLFKEGAILILTTLLNPPQPPEEREGGSHSEGGGAADPTQSDGTTTTPHSHSAAEEEESPRRAFRLKEARSMEGARRRSLAVRQPWLPSEHNFTNDVN